MPWPTDPEKRARWQENIRKSRKFGPSAKTLAREPLSDRQIGLIYGTLLGDSAISYSKHNTSTPHLYGTHGPKQREWVAYKASCLPCLEVKVSEGPNRGYGTVSVRYASHTHIGLIDIFNTVRPGGGKKAVSRDWLDRVSDEGMAWWYMDDGSLAYVGYSPCAHLHTEGFSHGEQVIIRDWLAGKGFECTIRDSGRGHEFIAFTASSGRAWIDRLRHYCIPSLAYKFRVPPERDDVGWMQGRLKIKDIRKKARALPGKRTPYRAPSTAPRNVDERQGGLF